MLQRSRHALFCTNIPIFQRAAMISLSVILWDCQSLSTRLTRAVGSEGE